MSPTEQAWSHGSVPHATGSPELHSIGAYLAAQRDLRGISLEELAQLTRIPLRSLARLESGTYDGVTDGFVRGFVRTVAESLGLEPGDTVARMLCEPLPEQDVRPPERPMLRRLLLAASLLLLLLLAVGLVRAVIATAPAPKVVSSEQLFRHDSVRALADAHREAAIPIARPAPIPPPAETPRASEIAVDPQPTEAGALREAPSP